MTIYGCNHSMGRLQPLLILIFISLESFKNVGTFGLKRFGVFGYIV